MSRPIRIDFVAEVADYLRSVKKVEVSTEDVADALLHVSNDAQDLERKMAKAMKGAEKDVESLERVIKDLPKATDKAADGMRKDFDRVGDDAADAGRVGGESFIGNLGEGLSSGDISSVLQDTLGDLVSEVKGPASTAFAIGATAALVMWNAFSANEEAKKEATERLFEAFDEITGELDRREALRAGIEELGGGNFSQGLSDAKQYSDALNLSLAEVAEMVSGQVNPRTKETVTILEAQIAQLEAQKQLQGNELAPAQQDQLDAAYQLLGTTTLQQGALQKATDQQQAWADITSQTGANAEDLQQALEDAVADAAKIGTGNEELDGLLAKAEELGWELLTDQEKAALIGTGNPHIIAIRDRAQEVANALQRGKGYLDSFPDPSMPTAVDDSWKIRTNLEAAAAASARIRFPNTNIPLTSAELALNPYTPRG